MESLIHTPANQEKIGKVKLALHELLELVLQRGFHGTAALEVDVNEGTIQRIYRKTQRVDK